MLRFLILCFLAAHIAHALKTDSRLQADISGFISGFLIVALLVVP